MRKLSSILFSSVLLLNLTTKAQTAGKWELSVTGFINHNSIFNDPTLFTPSTFTFCRDCSASQSYPTFGFGGGFIADRVFKSNLILRTGMIFTQYNFLEKTGKPMADYYYSQNMIYNQPNAGLFSIENIDDFSVIQIPLNIGYRHKNIKMLLGFSLSPWRFNYSKATLYSGESFQSTISDWGFTFVTNTTLMYRLERYNTDILIGADFNYWRQRDFYKIGIEHQLYK